MKFSEHRMVTPDGPAIYARDYAPEGAARGVPVLCLHGLTRNSADFEAVAPAIVSLGRRVIVPDTRGRGRSDNDPDPARYRPEIYAADTLALLDMLGIARAVFLGTSMGGVMTMLTAAMAPGRIAAAILNDIGAEVDPAGVARIAAYVGRSDPFVSWDEMIASIRAQQQALFPDADDGFWERWAHRVARERPDGCVEFAYDPLIRQAFGAPQGAAPPDLWALFEALSAVPVLLIRGALSDILPAAGAAKMKRVKPDLVFVEIPGIGHAPTLEEKPSREAIAEFLSGVP